MAASGRPGALHETLSGWRLFGLLAAGLTALFAAAFAALGADEDGLAALVRFTARISFALFLPVYAASSLRRLGSTPASRWLLRNRRRPDGLGVRPAGRGPTLPCVSPRRHPPPWRRLA